MREQLLDIVKHTGGLGFIDIVKLTGKEVDGEKTISIEAVDNDRTVVVKGNFFNTEKNTSAIEGLYGEYGMGNLTLLNGLLNYPNFKTDGAKITVISRDRNGVNTPEEIQFVDEQKQKATYRLTSKDLVPDQPSYIGKSWDIDFTPSNSKIAEFGQLSSIYSSQESYFSVRTIDNELRFYIGEEESSSHRAFLVMDTDVKGKLAGELYWPINQILSILKLGKDENPEIKITSRGAFQINISSPFASYSFILPARKR